MLVESQVLQLRLINVAEAAEFLGISRNGLYIACRNGLVPHFKIQGVLRFDRDDLRAWLETQRRGPKVDAL